MADMGPLPGQDWPQSYDPKGAAELFKLIPDTVTNALSNPDLAPAALAANFIAPNVRLPVPRVARDWAEVQLVANAMRGLLGEIVIRKSIWL